MLRFAVIISIPAWLFFAPLGAGAESARSLVDTGNALYAAGEYDKAVEAYERALTEQPEVGELLFNKGNALFQKGDYDQAREAYKGAALHTKDLAIEASAHYNLGNTLFAQGHKELASDPRKTLSQWGQSVQHYQEALRIDPQLREAAQNIEVVRLALKDLGDRMKKAEEAAREQQKRREELKKELEEVIGEQETEIQRNDALQRRASEAPQESLDRDARALAADQDQTRRKTDRIAEKLKELQGAQPSPQPTGSPSAPAAGEHLQKAREAQQAAVAQLDETELEEARENQEKALQHLKESLTDPDASKKNQGQCPNPQAGDQSATEGEEDAPQQHAGKETQEGAQMPQQQAAEQELQGGARVGEEQTAQPGAAAAFSESPETILREEKEHRLELQRAHQGSYKPVDKDW